MNEELFQDVRNAMIEMIREVTDGKLNDMTSEFDVEFQNDGGLYTLTINFKALKPFDATEH